MDNQLDTPTKLEDLFLRFLRITILVVMVLTLLASVVYALSGLSGMFAGPNEYNYKNPDPTKLAEGVKDTLKDEDSKKELKSSTPPNAGKESPKTNPELEKEIDKQIKLIQDFIGLYNMNLTDVKGVKNQYKKDAETFALEPKDRAAILDFAKGRTKYIEAVTTNKEILEILKNKPFNEQFYQFAMGEYIYFYQDQIKEAARFAKEENERVTAEQSGSTGDFYIAGIAFGVFFLISLILVLVKIERNLRDKSL